MTRTVLQVLPRLVTGGVERGTIEVAAALVKAGWQAVVASEGGPMVREIEKAGGIHVTLPLASKNPLAMMGNIGRLKEVIHHYQINIVHARSRAPAWSAYYAAKQTHTPFVTTFHNAYKAQNALKRTYNSVMGKGERVIAISDFVGAYARDVFHVPTKILRVIPRGVDTYRFDLAQIDAARIQKLRDKWHLQSGNRIVMLPGRLTEWKGHRVFIDAIVRLKRNDIQAIIVGSGDIDYRRELMAQIDRLSLRGIVQLVGECDDMPAAFEIADIVVSASTRPEGFGRVIVEAQAMGCPVIATQHGGAEETVKNNETGILVAPGSADDMAAALKRLLDMPPDAFDRMAVAAIAHVRGDFTTDLMTRRTLAVYEEVLAAHAR